eukprot:GILJ01010424.1.p1 GENE.GILJ01010424.1~~GILJ01010424.1.p1  ORF type:complete len:1170 (-),score=133.32 GILJ01010424.1:130-3639(-)
MSTTRSRSVCTGEQKVQKENAKKKQHSGKGTRKRKLSLIDVDPEAVVNNVVAENTKTNNQSTVDSKSVRKRKPPRKEQPSDGSGSVNVVLPENYVELEDLFTALDTTCCLLGRRGVVPTFERVESTVSHLAGGIRLTLDHILQMASVSPSLVSLQYVHSDPHLSESPFVLEISIKHGNKRSAAQGAIVKRKRLFRTALETHFCCNNSTDVSIPCAPLPPHPSASPSFFSPPHSVQQTVQTIAQSSRPLDVESVISAEIVTVENVLDLFRSKEFYQQQIVHEELLPAREAAFEDLDQPLPGPLMKALGCLGVSRFFSHQAEAISGAVAGRHVVVSTSTSSGKSLCYNVPVITSLLKNPETVSLYLFPTKALAQDQLRVLRELASEPGLSEVVRSATFDGDTPQNERVTVKHSANVILTNPDMLHVGILPSHPTWTRLLSNLKYIVIDEAHMYRGVFGSHVACILRRLLRLCAHNGCHPTFICCSATIANPMQHFQMLVSSSIEPLVVSKDGSPSGHKRIVLWNPPLKQQIIRKMERILKKPNRTESVGEPAVPASSAEEQNPERFRNRFKRRNIRPGTLRLKPEDEAARNLMVSKAESIRKSPHIESARVFVELVKCGLRTILFCKVRKVCELTLQYAMEMLRSESPHLLDQVKCYRGGYTVGERREIEKELFYGNLRGVVATTALELGVDIGTLDATVQLGFPGSISSFWQQAGRAGRGRRNSLTFFVGYDSPIDQWFMRHPRDLFARSAERAILDAANPLILKAHLLCAACEKPLTVDDGTFFGSEFEPTLERLSNRNGPDGASLVYHHEAYHADVVYTHPAKDMSIRSIDGSSFTIIEKSSGHVLHHTDARRVFWEAHEGAVILHQGKQYIVKHLNLADQMAEVEASNVNYYTAPRDIVQAHVIQRLLLELRTMGPFTENSIMTDAELGVNLSRNRSEPLAPSSSDDLVVVTEPRKCNMYVSYGRVNLSCSVFGYRKIDKRTDQIVEMVDMYLPPIEYETFGSWIDVRPEVKRHIESLGLAYKGGVHAVSHALVALVPLSLLCDANDMGTECINAYEGAARPLRIILFDRRPGGIGLAKETFAIFPRLLHSALKLIQDCPCSEGCPSCIQHLHCSEYNVVIDKAAAIVFLRIILGLDATFNSNFSEIAFGPPTSTVTISAEVASATE